MAFPNSLFPGVYTQLVDTSFSIPASGSSTAFICVLSEKGPDNQLLSISSTDEILSKLGSIDAGKYGQGLLILSNWFLASSNAFVVRCMPDETNLPCQTTIYKNVFGTYSLSKIKMKEAAYANLGIAVNALGKLELFETGPVYYGEIEAVDLLTPPAASELTVGAKYAIPYGGEPATGAWEGKEGYIAEVQGIDGEDVIWQFSLIDSVGYANVGSELTKMAVAVNYVPLSETVKTWKEISEDEIGDEYVVVKDIATKAPEIVENGDSYIVANGEIETLEWFGKVGNVATWDSELNVWKFSTPDIARIEKEYECYTTPPIVPNAETLGKKYFVGKNATDEWQDKDGAFAEVVEISVEGSTTYAWKFSYASISNDGSTVLGIILYNMTDSKYEMFKEYVETKLEITWTTDMDATFPAYIRRTAEIDSIVKVSRPDLAKDNNSVEPLFIFYPVGRGSYYNNIQISMNLSAKSESAETDYEKTLILDIYDLNSGSKLLLESFEVSLNPEAIDAMNDTSLYIVNVLNTYSSILRCKAVNAMYLTSKWDYMKKCNSEISNLFTEYEKTHVIGSTVYSPSLANGTNGNLFKTDDATSVDWNVAKAILSKAYTGTIINPNAEDANNPYLTDVLDTEMVLIDIIFDAGYPKAVKTAIYDLITARSYDCVGIVDMLDNASAEAAYTARTSPTGIAKQFNTPYIAIYEPYTEIYDKFSGLDIWVSPIFHAARAYSTTDRDYGRHYAPAGINRGMCYGINKMRYNLYKESSYKDKFVTYCINPIICNRSGYVIYGQSTSYLKSSKFQDINIIRPIIQMERDLKLELANMLFEFNDEDTYAAIDTAVRSYLGNKMSEKVIENFSVKVYATDYDITQHRCRVEIVVTPKMVLYQILVTISV